MMLREATCHGGDCDASSTSSSPSCVTATRKAVGRICFSAVQQHETSRRSEDAKTRQECNCFAKCLAVLHEHIRLQPYISKSLPFLIRKCVTQRLMTYSVGSRRLAVHEDVPALSEATFLETVTTIVSPELTS